MRYQLTTLVLGEVSKSVQGKVFPPQALKKAPHYFETSVPPQLILDQEKIEIDGSEIFFQLKGYPPDILIIQASLEVPDIFSEKIFDLEEKIFEQSYKIFKQRGGNKEFSEIYSIFGVSHYEGEPEQFMDRAPIISSLLKSDNVALDSKEIEYTLSSQIQYAKHDLTIVDWDGAFIFDPEGEFEPSIEIISLANLQLVRHRILDRQLDERLAAIGRLIKKPHKKSFLPKNKEILDDLRKIIRNRIASITEFQFLEREIKLIGDWYSARFYDLLAKKFKIYEWRSSIKEKMASLEDLYSMFVENFSMSKKDQAEWLQIIAFFILQIGWFTLIIIEFIYFTR